MKLSKEILKSLVEKVTELTDKGQEEISMCSGYKRETITKAISTGNVSPKMIEKIELTFRDELKKSTYFEDKSKNELSSEENKGIESTNKIKVVHSKKQAISKEVTDEAFKKVVTKELAKLMAKVYNRDFVDVLEELNHSESLEISMLMRKLS